MQDKKRVGSTDRPIEDFEKDEFKIRDYIEGLAEFIEECETPMTIAVQGDWGSGKTSMMNMVRQYLKQNSGNVDIWFNTWQYSQFNMDDCLVITFLNHLIKELALQLPEMNDGKNEKIEKLKTTIKKVGFGMLKQYWGEVGSVLEEVTNVNEDKRELDFGEQLFELKESFQQIIGQVADSEDKRVVVFIDDLDRLQPMRAVELLETLKLYVDCDKCVFVMAIDTSVVFQGIREKYGKDMSDEKAQSFFDKMIQLPFKMPTAYYRLDGLLERLLDFLQDSTMNERERKRYISIIREVTDGNPRTIKRLANAVLLVDKVAVRRNLYDVNEKENVQSMIRRILVVLACMQLRYESVYGFLVNNITEEHMKRILDIKLSAEKELERVNCLKEGFHKIGLSVKVSSDDWVFYDIMKLFLSLSKNFVDWFLSRGNYEKSAIKKLMQVVSLNNIRDIEGITEGATENTMDSITNGDTESDIENTELSVAHKETLELSSKEMSVETENLSEEFLSDILVGMITRGNARKAYNIMVDKRVYPRLGDNMNYKQNEDLNEIRERKQKPEEFYLFEKIHNALKADYEVQCSHRDEEEAIFRYAYYKRYNLDGGLDKTFKAIFSFNALEKSVIFTHDKLEYNDKIEEVMECLDSLANEVKVEYKKLQNKYSDQIFPDKDLNQIESTRDEGGELQQICVRFYVVNERMADLVIESIKKIALCLDKLKYLDEQEERSGQKNVNALDMLVLSSLC